MEFGKIENIVEAEFRIVTPMFLGGADQQADDIRPSSVKGMLRFWWRALNWSRFRNSTTDDANALNKLHDEEARLFGSAVNDGKGGQGVFLMSLQTRGIKIGKPDIVKFSPQHYMAGQGVVFQKDASKDRDSLLSGEFTIRMRFRDTCLQSDRASVIEAMRLLGLIGGLGSRSRRGWGAIALVDAPTGIEKFNLPTSIEDYQYDIAVLFSTASDSEAPFSAFSSLGKVAYSQPVDEARKVIDTVGKQLGLYRGYGKKQKSGDHQTFSQNSKQNFIPDHDLMLDAAQGKNVKIAPKRLVFGMPHNYFFSSVNKSIQIQMTSGKHIRRSSPLMIHVHPIGGKFIGVMILMRAAFLPQGEKVVIGRNEVPVSVDWSVIENFMQCPSFIQGKKI